MATSKTVTLSKWISEDVEILFTYNIRSMGRHLCDTNTSAASNASVQKFELHQAHTYTLSNAKIRCDVTSGRLSLVCDRLKMCAYIATIPCI